MTSLRIDQSLWRKVAAAGIAVGLLVAVLVQVHAVYPVTGQLARKDPTFQLRGWDEIGAAVEQLSEDENAAYILTMSYGLNAQTDFLMKDKLPVIQVTERIRYIMTPDPDETLFEQPGLYITEKRRDKAGDLQRSFETVEELAVLVRKAKGVPLEDLVVYKVDGLKGAVFEPREK